MIHLMHHPKTIRLGLFRCESFIRCQSTRHIALEYMRAYCIHLRFLDFAWSGTISQSDFYLACAPMAHGCPSSLQYMAHLQYPGRVHLILLLLSHVKLTESMLSASGSCRHSCTPSNYWTCLGNSSLLCRRSGSVPALLQLSDGVPRVLVCHP